MAVVIVTSIVAVVRA